MTSREPRPARPLLGRHQVLVRLAELLEGDAAVALVGEAGIGKTSVARAAAAASGRHLYEGGGFATLAWMPYLALRRAVDATLTGVEPSLVAREVTAQVGNGILFIDDLQWTDPGTRAVVAELAGRIALLLAVRAGDPAAESALAFLPSTVIRVTLEPLARRDVIALARRRRPDLDPPAASRIVRLAGGNPLLVEELADVDDDHASLDSVIRRRMSALDASTREALVMLGLAGRPLRLSVLGAGAMSLASAGLASLDPDGRMAIRHELLGVTAVAAVTPETRRRLEARLARLAETPGDAARHHAAAGEPDLAHRRALEAAARATSPGERARHLTLAAEMADGAGALDLRFQAAALLADGLEPDAALALVADVDPSEATRPERAAVIALAHLMAYRLEEARTAALSGLAGLVPGDPASVADEIALRVLLARIAVRALGSTDEAMALARHAHDLSRVHGIGAAPALAALGNARCLAGDTGGLDDLETAMETSLTADDPAGALVTGSQLVFNLLKWGRASDGRHLARRLATHARDARLLTWRRQMSAREVGFAWHAGDFLGAVEMAEGTEADDLWSDLAEWYRTQALCDLGRHEEAGVHVSRLLADAGPGEYDIGEVRWVQADAAFAAGRFAEAVEAADRHAAEVPDAHHRLFVEITRAWAIVELGRPPTWPSLEARLPIVEGASIELEALRDLARGQPAEAARGFDRATAAWVGRHARGELRSTWAAAESLRRADRERDARDRLLALEERLVTLEARPLLGRVRRSLRLVGVRRAATTDRRSGSVLTAREGEILALVGRGLRDQEIAAQLGISRWAVLRTVGSASAKLGAATRGEAIAALAGGR